MRLTQRDISLIRDIALSHVLSRDQVLGLSYFSSVSRTNVRLKMLVRGRYLRILVTPFFKQNLYIAGPDALAAVGEKIARLIRGRGRSPQFLQHALAVTNVRINLKERGFTFWRFEQQLWQDFTWRGHRYEVRPDGLAYREGVPVFIEVDLGHVAAAKFASKLDGYQAFQESGRLAEIFGTEFLSVLVVTTGKLRKTNLREVSQRFATPWLTLQTFEELEICCPGAWR
ncbi:MAG TPA: replication-relaxation family protein [Fimbriimonadaceae bacterium]|jgi:hypothetical protein